MKCGRGKGSQVNLINRMKNFHIAENSTLFETRSTGTLATKTVGDHELVDQTHLEN